MSHTPMELLMGAKTGQMNLLAVRARAEEIRRTLNNLLNTLRFAPASLQWSDALDKFAVLNIQLQNLSVQLRPLLQHYAIHPRSVNQTNAPILPIMLATKLLPEQEAEQQAMLADGLAPADAQECLKATAELAALIDSITQNGGPLDPKGPLRAKLAASVKSATNLEQEKKPVGPPATGLSGTQPVFGAVGQPQAPSPLEGADLLLAAASYGAGL